MSLLKSFWQKFWVSRQLMVLGSLLLLGVFVFPLWSITLQAPQYPEPLGMEIWVHQITDKNPNDLSNINLMNHYVGMDPIPEHLPEFDLFPIVIIFMSLLGLVFAYIGKKNLYLVWFGLMLIFGFAGIYDFYIWEYNYGHNLDPKAAIKFLDELGNPLSYQPPMFGKKVILNFTAISLPMLGAFIVFSSMVISLMAYMLAVGRYVKVDKTE